MNDRPRKWTSFGQMMQNQFSQIKTVRSDSPFLFIRNLEAVMVHNNNNKLGRSLGSVLSHLSVGYAKG